MFTVFVAIVWQFFTDIQMGPFIYTFITGHCQLWATLPLRKHVLGYFPHDCEDSCEASHLFLGTADLDKDPVFTDNYN